MRIKKPGLPIGMANLSLSIIIKSFGKSLKRLLKRLYCISHDSNKRLINNQRIIIEPMLISSYEIEKSQVNYQNEDYLKRKPYHHYK
jgi:hypothetical protein